MQEELTKSRGIGGAAGGPAARPLEDARRRHGDGRARGVVQGTSGSGSWYPPAGSTARRAPPRATVGSRSRNRKVAGQKVGARKPAASASRRARKQVSEAGLGRAVRRGE